MQTRPLLTLALLLVVTLHAQKLTPLPDPPPDAANPPALVTFQIPSHGDKLNALAYTAAGPGPHPTVILLHGFPGNERNLDLAQAIRRSGRNVLFFDYRGSWGTPGTFTFAHTMEDTSAAIAWLREPANVARLHSDPANIILIGHSMGGMIAANITAHDPSIRALGLISAANMAGRLLPAVQAGKTDAAIQAYLPRLIELGTYPLAGCTPESLAKELAANAATWNFPTFAPQLHTRPVLLITSDDGLAPDADHLASSLRDLKDPSVTTLHLATDHSYSGQRLALEAAVLQWLGTLPLAASAPPPSSPGH